MGIFLTKLIKGLHFTADSGLVSLLWSLSNIGISPYGMV